MRRAALVFVLAAAALAFGRPAAGQPKGFGFEAYGAWSWYTMSDVNDSLSALNNGIGSRFDAIHAGPGWGVGLRIWGRSDLLIRLGFEMLAASTEDPVARFDLSAYDATLGLTWFVNHSGALRTGYGFDVGPYYARGELSSPVMKLDTHGNGFGATAHAEAMMPIRNGWSVTAMLGFRYAVIPNLQFEDSNSDLDVQYVGPFVRLSLAGDSTPAKESLTPP